MTAMMKAAIFVDKGRIELAEKPIHDGANQRAGAHHHHHHLRHGCTSRQGEYLVAKGPTGPRAGGRDRQTGQRHEGLPGGPARGLPAPSAPLNSYAAQDGAPSQDGSYLVPRGRNVACHGYKATAGWRLAT